MIEVKLPKCVVFVTEAEFLSLLAHDKDIWARAIARGKAAQKARTRETRQVAREARRAARGTQKDAQEP